MASAGVGGGGRTNRTTGTTAPIDRTVVTSPESVPYQSAGKVVQPMSAADLTEYAPGYNRPVVDTSSFDGNVFAPGNPVGVYGTPNRRQYALSDYITNPYGGGGQ
jgi:hypothetical protein